MPVGRCGMTDIAGFVGRDMGVMFTRRLNPVMAGRTGARYDLTVIETDRFP